MSVPLSAEDLRATAGLASFVEDIERVVARESDPHPIAAAVQARLPGLLADPDFLAPEYREPWPDHYRSHLLVVAPSRRFSVVSMVWLPEQVTPIHDHICWCVVGVLQGLERERRYSLHEGRHERTADGQDGERWLVPLDEDTVTPGHTCALIPPDENIHLVRNAGDGLAISIHVYGEDIAVYGSSINQCFGDLPIRPGDTSGAPVAWRRVLFK
jgi:predicted metal-dependent enzyme (double-stranded beta helix superfamily)